MAAQLKASIVHSQVPTGQCTACVCLTVCHVFLTQQAADSLCVLFILEYRMTNSTEWCLLVGSMCRSCVEPSQTEELLPGMTCSEQNWYYQEELFLDIHANENVLELWF